MCPQLVAKTKYIDTLIKLLLTYLLTLINEHALNLSYCVPEYDVVDRSRDAVTTSVPQL